MTLKVTTQLLDDWAMASDGPVALHLKQKLLPVEGEGGVIFPPTYADIGYNIDSLADGTRVATIDSVGSQANRQEPVFKSAADERDEWLVPQIEIVLGEERCGECKPCKSGPANGRNANGACRSPHKVTRSILDLAHRAADAVVRASPGLAELIESAFHALRKGDAGPLCVLAPTSLVFGVWDSRGSSGERRPRLLRSMIRAWDIEPIHAAAQFNSVSKWLPDDEKDALEKEAKKQKTKLSEKGFADAPSVFRKTEKVPHRRDDGAPNPEARVLGGVIARGPIERTVTANLVALRAIRGKNEKETHEIRRYLLGLTLYAAMADIELFLREGCLLRYAREDLWTQVPRRGEPTDVNLGAARALVEKYVRKAAKPFRDKWPKELVYRFDLSRARTLLKSEDEASSGVQ